jgi:hypothetical protein
LFRVVLRLKGTKQIFKLGQIIFDLFIFAKKRFFQKFDPLTTTLCVDLGPKCKKFIPLSLRLNGIEFRLVCDLAKFNSISTS